jgi:hypothetical protein
MLLVVVLVSWTVTVSQKSPYFSLSLPDTMRKDKALCIKPFAMRLQDSDRKAFNRSNGDGAMEVLRRGEGFERERAVRSYLSWTISRPLNEESL